MDVEELVKKHRPRGNIMQRTTEEMLRAALTEMAAGYEERLKKIQADDLMAQCMEQTRSDLIAAGVIGAQCSPMFLADAVIAKIRNLEQKDYTGGDAELLRERIRQLEAGLVPSPSCRECANRGRVNGLSQESYCDSCVWQGQSFRVNHYAAAQQPKKEGE